MSEDNRNNEKRSHDCCGCNEERLEAVPNQCKEKCCYPKEVRCGDIHCARCIPIIAERVFDCVCLESGGMKYIKDLEFEITSNGKYQDGDEICIDNIAVSYGFIGLRNNRCNSGPGAPLEVIVDNSPDNPIEFMPPECSPSARCWFDGGKKTLYNTYSASLIATNLDCCEKGKKSKIAEEELAFYVCDLVIYVYGKIGCEPFTAKTDRFSGKLADFGGNGFKDIDFLGTVCFPSGKTCVNMELKFDGCISVDCVTPKCKYHECDNNCNDDDYSGREKEKKFEASVLASLLVTQQVYVTVKEELAVYTTPGKIACKNGNISSSCDSQCDC